MRHSFRAQQALAQLPEIDPAIAALAIWCSFRDGFEPTFTLDEAIYIGPEFASLPISEQTGLIAHHVLHVALRHSFRRTAAQARYGAEFRAELYDLACDAIVNEALLQGAHALPRPAVRVSELMSLLPVDQKSDNILSDLDSGRLYTLLLQVATKVRQGNGNELDEYIQSREFKPDLKSGIEQNIEAEVWAGRIEQALSAGKRAGTGIGPILVGFGELPKATVPWEVRLRRMLGKALMQPPKQSYRRPSRSWLARDSLTRERGNAQPAFEPAVARDEPLPRLVIALDTSSSIDEPTLDMFAAEALSIVRRTGAEAQLLGFDTEVHHKSDFSGTFSLSTVLLRRGGGTEFDPVLIEAQSVDPSMIIVLTDLDASASVVPKAPILWAVPEAPPQKPKFGDILIMRDDT